MRQELDDSKTRASALNYLVLWKEDKGSWKFNKNTQSWLFARMYSLEAVPSKYFKLLMKYMDGLQGGWKERLRKEALEIVENNAKLKFDRVESRIEDDEGKSKM